MKKKYIDFLFIGIFSLIIGFVYSITPSIAEEHLVRIQPSILLLSSCICFVSLTFLFRISSRLSQNDRHAGFEKKHMLGFFLLFFVSYAICLCTYFPGVTNNDQLNIMLWTIAAGNQFPLFYCGFIHILMRFFPTTQMFFAFCTISQIIIIALMHSYVMVWLSNQSPPKVLQYITVAYYAACPLLIMYSITFLRDVTFSVALFLFMILLYRLAKNDQIKEKPFWLLFLFSCFCLIFTRSNGIFVTIPSIILAFFVVPKRRKALMIVCFICLFAFVLQSAAIKILGIQPHFQEKVGIPIQQIAATVYYDGKIGEEEAEFINRLMPIQDIKESYDPFSCDAIKWNHFDRAYLNEHQNEFIKVWFRLLPDNFSIYVRSYLCATYGFWSFYQEDQVQYFAIIANYGHPWLEDYLKESGLHTAPLFPDHVVNSLKHYYQLSGYFFREGVCFWLMLISAFLVWLRKKNLRCLLFYFPAVFLWITLMISTPVAFSMRYVAIFIYAFPVIVAMPFFCEKPTSVFQVPETTTCTESEKN